MCGDLRVFERHVGDRVFTIVYGVSSKWWISGTKFSKWERIVTVVIKYQLIMRLSMIIIVSSIGIIVMMNFVIEVDSVMIIGRKGVIERNNS